MGNPWWRGLSPILFYFLIKSVTFRYKFSVPNILCLCKVLCGYLFLYAFFVQTDMMDLLGSDLPVESDEGMKFSWSDGILLQVEMSYNESYHILLCS